MAVTINQTDQTGPTTWKVTFSSDLGGTPVFSLYQNGVLITTTTATEWTFTVADLTSSIIEIFDDATSPATYYPGRMTLAWDAPPEATDYYLIEQKVASVWTERARIYDRGESYFSWNTLYLDDVTTHEFRVSPIGANGVTGQIRLFTALMVRYPDIPNVTYTYDSGTAKVTIAAVS